MKRRRFNYAACASVVLFVLVAIALLGWPSSLYLWHRSTGMPMAVRDRVVIGVCFALATALSVSVWQIAMSSGVAALERMGE